MTLIATIAQDVSYTFRQLRRAPVFTLTATLTLAIGIGANTGLFSLLNLLLRPLPVPHADEVVVVAAELPGDETGFRFKFSYAALSDYRNQTRHVFSDVFGFDTRIGGMTANGHTSQFVYHAVTGNFFEALQLTPTRGRFFTAGEGEHPGGEIVIVLGHSFWQTRFGGDPAVVGSTVRLDGGAARIVGVAPPGFHGLYNAAEMEGYVTLASLRGPTTFGGELFSSRTIRVLTMLARLKPDATIAAAQSAVNVVARRLHADYPDEHGISARVLAEPMARPIPLRFLTELLPLARVSTLGLAGIVLLIACMNVVNLLLIRATVRQREMAVRTALGAGRPRLMRLLITESLMLAAAGTIAGLVLARWAMDLFMSSVDLAVDLPLALDVHYDWRIFSYAAAIALVTGVAVGVVPAWRASRGQVATVLHDGGYGGSAGGARHRLRSALVIAQVAGSLVLLVVAGLLVRSLQQAQWVELGFDPDHLLTVRLDPRQIGYGPERNAAFYEEIDRRVRALAGVESVATAFSVPMGYIFDTCVLRSENTIADEDDRQPSVGCNTVSPSYFETMRIPLTSGRAFADQDTEDATRVIIVNETMAARQWPGAEPLGQVLRFARFEGAWTVVGVARNSKYLAVFEKPLPQVYLPMAQHPSYLRVLHVRSTVPPEMLGPQLEREIHALDPEMPIADLKTMRRTIAGGMGFMLFRWGTVQAAATGLLGLLLAIVGVYGVVSYGASQRAREMGIRLALGAEPRAIRTLVLGQGALLVLGGVVCGLAMAVVFTRLIASFLFLISATDLTTFLVVTVLLSTVAMLACYLPARRAMRVDPMIALRHE